MTNNKIIPFCCDMSNATEQEIEELHKKCLEAGAVMYDSVEEWVDYRTDYPFMGVTHEGDTLAHKKAHIGLYFSGKVLSYDQVEAHLSLTSEADKPSVSDSPVKWTIAMHQAGKPLEVGLIALNEYGIAQKVLFLGNKLALVESTMNKEEYSCDIRCLVPLPDEETPEQVEQREEFIHIMSSYLPSGDNLAEDCYDDLKKLFKY